jgi:hypothetical protein
VNSSTTNQAGHPQPDDADLEHREAAASDFAATRPVDAQDSQPGWWPESADGRCSESAALFAASQPAPLSIV